MCGAIAGCSLSTPESMIATVAAEAGLGSMTAVITDARTALRFAGLAPTRVRDRAMVFLKIPRIVCIISPLFLIVSYTEFILYGL
jgi:hypothetical protein